MEDETIDIDDNLSEFEDLLVDEDQGNAPEPEGEDLIDLGEDKFSKEELKRLIEKGRGADRKFQEAAEMRKQVDEVMELSEAWKRTPDSVKQQVIALVEQAENPQRQQGMPNFNMGALDDINMDELYDNEKKILTRQLKTEQAISQLAAAVSELAKGQQEILGATTMSRAINVAVEELSTEGIQTTAKEVQAAVEATGIKDPKLALKAVRYDKDRQEAWNSGKHEKDRLKPRAPGSGSAAIDPKKATADQIYQAMKRGIKVSGT